MTTELGLKMHFNFDDTEARKRRRGVRNPHIDNETEVEEEVEQEEQEFPADPCSSPRFPTESAEDSDFLSAPVRAAAKNGKAPASIDASVMAMAIMMRKALSESAAAALKLGNPVRIISGEQNGITGKVHGISSSSISVFPDLDAIVPIEVPFTNVRLHLRPGEYIRVKSGPQAGRMGWVVNVEYKADEDIVTFVDDKMAESERVVTLLQREMRVLPIEGPQEIVASTFIVEIFDPPIESTSFPCGILEPESAQNGMEVNVVGDHRFATRNGTIRGVAKFNDSGVHSYIVELEPDNLRVPIQTVFLVPRNVDPLGCVVEILFGPHTGKLGRICDSSPSRGFFNEVIVVLADGEELSVDIYDIRLEATSRNGVHVPFRRTLPGIGFNNRRRPSRHPSVGSLVTVGGKNVHSGLHGEIYEVTSFDDNLEPECFSVFLTAKFRCVPIRRQFLSLRQGENHSRWALDFFKFCPPLKRTRLAVLPHPTSLPHVPSTPLPSVTTPVSPAWDPSSRTPVWHAEREEASDGDTPPHRQIPKPKGKLNRSDGFNLKQSLGLDETLFSAIQKHIETLASEHLDLSKSLGKQSNKDRALVFSKARKEFPILKNFKGDWAADCFLKAYLKTANQRLKRQASAQ